MYQLIQVVLDGEAGFLHTQEFASGQPPSSTMRRVSVAEAQEIAAKLRAIADAPAQEPPKVEYVRMRGAFFKAGGAGTWFCGELDENIKRVEADAEEIVLDLLIPRAMLERGNSIPECRPQVEAVQP